MTIEAMIDATIGKEGGYYFRLFLACSNAVAQRQFEGS